MLLKPEGVAEELKGRVETFHRHRQQLNIYVQARDTKDGLSPCVPDAVALADHAVVRVVML